MTSRYMYAQVITTMKDQKVQAKPEELRLLASKILCEHSVTECCKSTTCIILVAVIQISVTKHTSKRCNRQIVCLVCPADRLPMRQRLEPQARGELQCYCMAVNQQLSQCFLSAFFVSVLRL